MKNLLKLIASIIICNLAGILGSLFTTPSIPTWYSTLQKPAFTPPGWLFAPVWLLLYTLMGISLYLILGKKDNKKAISLFAIQLFLNAGWSILFFGLHSPFLALIEIILLLLAIILTLLEFQKLNKKAAYLLLPYLLWVSFAAILNFSIWTLNP